MRILFLVTSSDGHHLEYLEHLILLAERNKKDEYVFSIHPKLAIQSVVSRLDASENCQLDILSDADVNIPKGRLKSSLFKCRLLKRKIKEHNADKVFLIMLMPYGPFVFLPIWNNVKITGIIYNIYLYKWESMPLVEKLFNVLRYWLMTHSKNIQNVLILNDEDSASKLNQIYHSEKFKYLVDPYRPILEVTSKYTLRELYSGKKIISHIGMLKERKGSFDILRTVCKMSAESLKDYVFVFAGKSENDEMFEALIEKAREKATIIWYKGFLDFDEMGEIVSESDALLLPYHNTNQSSGIISYGAQFNVPVVVPNADLLGNLVKKYELGVTIDGYSINNIEYFLLNPIHPKVDGSKYLKVNNVTDFVNIIEQNI